MQGYEHLRHKKSVFNPLTANDKYISSWKFDLFMDLDTVVGT